MLLMPRSGPSFRIVVFHLSVFATCSRDLAHPTQLLLSSVSMDEKALWTEQGANRGTTSTRRLLVATCSGGGQIVNQAEAEAQLNRKHISRAPRQVPSPREALRKASAAFPAFA